MPDCDGARLTAPTLSPMTGRHTDEVSVSYPWKYKTSPCRDLRVLKIVGICEHSESYNYVA